MILLAIQPLYIVQIALFDSWQNLVKVSLFSKKKLLKAVMLIEITQIKYKEIKGI